MLDAERFCATVKAICQSDCYHEQDTVERVIVPLLRMVFGRRIDDVGGKFLVRDNRNTRGFGRLGDLNLFGNSQLKCVIECKEMRTKFIAREKDAKRGFWEPELSKGQKAKVEENLKNPVNWENGKRGLMWNKIVSQLLPSDKKNEFGVFVLDIIKDLWNNGIFVSGKCRNSPDKYWLSRVVAWVENNPDNDYLGQLWRFCNDGRHAFKHGQTKIVWTNGIEWVFFTDAFTSFVEWPRVIVDGRTKDFVDGEGEYYEKISFPDPTAELNKGILANWMEVFMRLRQKFNDIVTI